MKLQELRSEIVQTNKDHPEFRYCIYPNCKNKVDPDPDNYVLCEEHNLLFLFWFYECDGAKYCPEIWQLEDFGDRSKMLPKPEGSDKNMAAYRKRYCDWIASLSPERYLEILKFQIGDTE